VPAEEIRVFVLELQSNYYKKVWKLWLEPT